MVYAHASSAKLTKSKVYRKIDRALAVDDYKPVPTGMSCTRGGGVELSSGPSKALAGRQLSLFQV